MNHLSSTHSHGYHTSGGVTEPLNCMVKFNFESADLVATKLYNYATSTYTTSAINGTKDNSIYKYGAGSFFGSSVTSNSNVTCNSVTVATPSATTEGVTFSIWIYIVAAANNTYYLKSTNNIQLGFTSNKFNSYINGTWTTSPNSCTLNTWIHMVCTCRYTGPPTFSTTGNGAYTYYVNGGTANGGYQYTGTGNYWVTGAKTPVLGGGTSNCTPGYFDNVL